MRTLAFEKLVEIGAVLARHGGDVETIDLKMNFQRRFLVIFVGHAAVYAACTVSVYTGKCITMPSLSLRSFFIVTLVMFSGLFVGCASAAETDPDGRLYQPSADPIADVQRALSRAEDSSRLALVVLGANWCHDSRALAARLHRSPLAELVQQLRGDGERVVIDLTRGKSSAADQQCDRQAVHSKGTWTIKEV